MTHAPVIANCMNGVMVDPASGLLMGGACWRGDGQPIGLSGGYASLPRRLVRLAFEQGRVEQGARKRPASARQARRGGARRLARL